MIECYSSYTLDTNKTVIKNNNVLHKNYFLKI